MPSCHYKPRFATSATALPLMLHDSLPLPSAADQQRRNTLTYEHLCFVVPCTAVFRQRTSAMTPILLATNFGTLRPPPDQPSDTIDTRNLVTHQSMHRPSHDVESASLSRSKETATLVLHLILRHGVYMSEEPCRTRYNTTITLDI